MKAITTTTALAAILALGVVAAPSAQTVDPRNPSSAAGGIQAQAPAGQMGQAAQPGQAAAMSEEQIRNALRARGYSDMSGVERDGDYFKVEKAQRYGRDVENIRVNARTGQVRDEARLNEDQARKLLESRGYSEVSNVERDGNTINARVKRDGRETRVQINAETGMVTPRTDG